MVANGGQRGEGLVGLLLRMRQRGIVDQRLFDALEATDRAAFLRNEFRHLAWSDKSVPLPCGQTLHSVDVSAAMLAALDVTPSDSVLVIGTGSGFTTAVLARLARKVHTTDRYQSLLAAAQDRFAGMGLNNVSGEQLDAVNASGGTALYDRIYCELAFEEMPRMLLDRVASNGTVVTAIGPADQEQSVVRLTKIGSRFDREDLFSARLMPPEHGLAEAL